MTRKAPPSQPSLLQSHEPFDGSITIKIRFWTCAISDNKQFSLSLVCVKFLHSLLWLWVGVHVFSREYWCYIAYRGQCYVVYKIVRQNNSPRLTWWTSSLFYLQKKSVCKKEWQSKLQTLPVLKLQCKKRPRKLLLLSLKNNLTWYSILWATVSAKLNVFYVYL